jgi:hypothetical protein
MEKKYLLVRIRLCHRRCDVGDRHWLPPATPCPMRAAGPVWSHKAPDVPMSGPSCLARVPCSSRPSLSVQTLLLIKSGAWRRRYRPNSDGSPQRRTGHAASGRSPHAAGPPEGVRCSQMRTCTEHPLLGCTTSAAPHKHARNL